MAKSALVVDDSRVALAALSRMLKDHGLAVETAESGSEAIDYLRMNLYPSVIFLDHMMPGMDGFETLRTLKSDPRTSKVPVVMYTSTEGESYMGQALAAGAVDVLRKPINPVELLRILQRFKPQPEQELPLRTAPPKETRTRAPTANDIVALVPPLAANTSSLPSSRPMPAIDVGHEPSAVVMGAHDTPSPAIETDTNAQPTSGSKITKWLLIGGLYTLLLLLPTIWYFVQYQQVYESRMGLLQENAKLKSEIQRAVGADESDQLRVNLAAQERSAQQQARTLAKTIAWALNLHGQYDVDQLPLGDETLNRMRELIARLTVADFRGQVRIDTHVAEFCLVRDEQGVYRMPPRNLPFSRCEVVTYSPEYAALLGRRQSTGFARFLAEEAPDDKIKIEVVSLGKSRPLAPYPDRLLVQTAGEWNQVARINNRIEITLAPAP